MKTIEYQAVYADGDIETVRLKARDINSGFTKALKVFKEPLGNGTVRELHSIEFRVVY